jgi:hypothetical protein
MTNPTPWVGRTTNPRSEFDALLVEALDALAVVVDDGEIASLWRAHRALNRAMILLDAHRWDAQ